MILVVTTKEHRYTHAALEREAAPRVRVISYDELLSRGRPYRATYIFTDLDRLPAWRVQKAAIRYRELRAAGLRALNDPARVLGRFGLLRGLHRSGFNRFNAYRLDELAELADPPRWPVFLRMEGDHKAPVSGLLNDQDELARAVAESVERGVPRSALLIIEYAAEPVRPGLFRRLSVFRVGERLLGYTCAHDDNWLVKYGKPGVAPPELYDEEHRFVATDAFGAEMLPVFELAGVEYGRVDFGLVEGRPQVYEINSNPHVQLRPAPSPVEMHNKSTALFATRYLEAMAEIDSGRQSVPMVLKAGSLVWRAGRRVRQMAGRR